MTPLEALIEEFPDDEFLRFDGFDDAVVGFCISHWRDEAGVLVYDYQKMVDTLVMRDGMDSFDAEEFLDFNTLGAYAGEKTPIVIRVPRYDTP